LNFASWFHLTNHQTKTTIYVGRRRAIWNPVAGRGLDSTGLDAAKSSRTNDFMVERQHIDSIYFNFFYLASCDIIFFCLCRCGGNSVILSQNLSTFTLNFLKFFLNFDFAFDLDSLLVLILFRLLFSFYVTKIVKPKYQSDMVDCCYIYQLHHT